MPFTAVQAQMAELQAEIAKFNEEAPGLHDDVKKLRKVGKIALIVGAIGAFAFIVALGVVVWAVRGNQNTIDVNDYNACIRGNNVRAAVIDGFETTLNTVIGPPPGEDATAEEIANYKRNIGLRDLILQDIETGALQARDCGKDPR